MFDITVDDVVQVYEQLKDRYDLVLTTTSALDEGFTDPPAPGPGFVITAR